VGGAWLHGLLLPVARALHPVESALGRHARAEDRVQAAAERTRQPWRLVQGAKQRGKSPVAGVRALV
jgi:hypothetical protein